jgi:small acid-soluble spore protein (thioredoxin-like protein)
MVNLLTAKANYPNKGAVTMAKPDNRADNVENLQSIINHTIANHEEADEYLAAHADEVSPQQREAILDKNERREESLEALRSEIKDEAEYQRRQ